MSQGTGDTLTLYDKEGNEITVTLKNNRYKLNVSTPDAVRLLQKISTQLEEIQEILIEGLQ